MDSALLDRPGGVWAVITVDSLEEVRLFGGGAVSLSPAREERLALVPARLMFRVRFLPSNLDTEKSDIVVLAGEIDGGWRGREWLDMLSMGGESTRVEANEALPSSLQTKGWHCAPIKRGRPRGHQSSGLGRVEGELEWFEV